MKSTKQSEAYWMKQNGVERDYKLLHPFETLIDVMLAQTLYITLYFIEAILGNVWYHSLSDLYENLTL